MLSGNTILPAHATVDSLSLAQGTGSIFSDVTQLLWLLLIPVALILAGILWLAMVRITARRQSMEAARRTAELEAWYRDLFDNAHDILLTLDVEGHLVSLNRAGRALLGNCADPASNRRMLEWLAPEDRSLFEEMLRGLHEGQAMAHGEIALLPAPGQRVVWRLNLRRQALPGRPVEIRGVAWDVTAQRQAQDALRDSEQRLRHSLEERIRIGRDLHDGIIQSIYAVGLALGDCRRLIDDDPGQARARLAETIKDLNGVIREVRGFIEGLEPEALKGREFRTALDGVASQLGVSDRAGWTLDVDPDAANGLSSKQVAGLLQIAKEALSNALRHSRAVHVKATLTTVAGGEQTQLEISDDGCGFDQAHPSRTGLGLRNMQARAEEMAGRFAVRSAAGQGTTVRVTLPVQERGESH
jgi:PAS domain S-box-containing protein